MICDPLLIHTLGGGQLHLVNPTIEQIDFSRISIALSRVQRCAAQTEKGLSIAQHMVEGARAIMRDTGRRDMAAAFLLHDVHEAFMGDIATPVLEALCAIADEAATEHGPNPHRVVRRAVKTLKKRLDAVIYAAAGIAWPLPEPVVKVVKEYDLRMLRTERDLFMSPPPHRWIDAVENAEPVAGVTSEVWSARCARVMWLAAFQELC